MEFRKNGFNDSDAATLAKTATVFQNVSDEAISAGESASFIISQMIAFGIEAENAQSIIDKVNETANKFSVSSGDLSKALGIVASTSSAMGNSIDQTLGVVTAITEQTRNASKSARAANTIFSRLAQVVDENSDTGKKLTEIYNNLGIALYDSSGQMRSTYDILADLSSKWDSLDKNTQQYIAITSAGTNQLNNFLALMNNFDHAAEATATSINSAGSAMRENEAFQESLEYQTNNLKATFQDLANNVIDKELISSLLKLGDAFLKLANTDIGVLVTKIGLLAGAGWGLSSLIQVSKIIPVIVGQFKNFGAVLSLVAEGSGTFGAALSAAGGAGAVALPIFLAVSAAIVGIVEAVKAYKDSHPDFDTAAQSVATLSDSLKTAQDRLDEINKLGWKDRTRAINEEEQELKDLIAQQERELQVAQMRQAMAAGEELSERTGYGQATRYTAISPNDTDNQTFASMDEAVKSLAETEGITGESTDELKQKLLDLGYAFVTTTENTKLTADEMNALDTQALQELSGSIKENGELNTYLKDSYQGLYDELAPTYEKLVNLENAQRNAIPGARELTNSERELKGAFEQLVGTMLSFESSGDNAYQTIANLANILGVTPSYARDLAVSMGLVDRNTRYVYDGLVQLENGTWAVADGFNAAKTASNGVAESMSGISHAMAEVQGTTSQFVGALFNMNGELTTTGQAALTGNQGLWSLANAEAAANQQAAQTNFDNLVSEILSAGQAASWSAQQLAQMFAYAGLSTGAISSTYGDITTDKRAQMAYGAREFKSGENLQSYLTRVAKENLEKAIKESDALKNLGKNLGYTTGVGGGGGSSRKSAEEKAAEEAEKQAKKAQQAQEKAAKQSQQAYESAAKSAEQAAQEAARAAEQAAEEAKQKILDSIQELKDASDDFWDSKTDAIEETNKELDRQKQLEEKLKALEEAKQKKILLYKNGQFQYDKDYGTIAKAQADYEETRDKIQRERELEQLQEMKDNATEIFNEMKDIVQNGGDITQSMINKWLSQMQADGANYYESNKAILSDWLAWAQGAIKEFSQSALESIGGGYTSTSGTYGPNATAGGGLLESILEYQQNPKYWRNGEFIGMGAAMWTDLFEAQLASGYFGDYTTMPESIGKLPGSSVFDDWQKAFEYWARDSMQSVDALEDMIDRLVAAKGVLDRHKDEFKSLGLDDLYQKALDIQDIDEDKLFRYAKLYGAVQNPDMPFGFSPYLREDEFKNLDPDQKLAALLPMIRDYEYWTGSRTAEGEHQEWFQGRMGSKDYTLGKDYGRLTYTGDLVRTAKTYTDEGKKIYMFTDAAGDYYVDRKKTYFDQKKLAQWYEENERAISEIQEKLWEIPGDELLQKALEQELERRRQARVYSADVLGYDTEAAEAQSEYERERQSSVGYVEAKRQRKTDENLFKIQDALDRLDRGNQVSDKYLSNASDYIGKVIEENAQKILDANSDAEKKALEAQNAQLELMRQQVEEGKTGQRTENVYEWEDAEFEDYDPTEDVARMLRELQQAMQENSKAWWDADEETRKQLHESNIRLAKQIEDLSNTRMTYEGHTGVWTQTARNATGTHNFRGGLSLVGENGPELRVLRRGDNIIPANQTANLWKWSNTTPQQMLTTLSARSGGGNTSYTFDVSRIELPNVTDAKSFVQGLKNYALQYSYKR